MNFKPHYILECFLLIPIGCITFYFIRELYILPLIYISMFLGAAVPDLDMKINKKKHRDIRTHSLLIPLSCMALSYMSPILILFMAFWCVATGIHCLGDVRINKSKRLGYYTICYGKVFSLKESGFILKRLNGKQTTQWLIGQFIASLVILGLVAGWLM